MSDGERLGTTGAADRRAARRVWASAPAWLVVDAFFLVGGSPSGVPLSFYAHTRDVSDGGVAVVAPAVHFDAWVCGGGYPILIRVQVAGEEVEVEAAAAHCRALVASDSPSGIIVGAKVREVRAGGRTYPAGRLRQLLAPHAPGA